MEMEPEVLREPEDREEAPKKKGRKWLWKVLLAVFLIYCVYLAVPRHLTTVVPDIYQAECIAIHHHRMYGYDTLTVRGDEMRQLIDHLDQYTFQPSQPFSDINTGGVRVYYGELYNFYIYMDGTERWRVNISDKGDVSIDNIFGTDWLREGEYRTGLDQIQVMPPELEAQMEYHEIEN